ncbi:hypothetical protein SS50377_23873 [Spironucleus salmonicida]|uniref:Uncharacterized protein n=1 Tax=Spironucleus salmonicida TaxID=348837 RepID=A0A9P8LTD9_9EUKA|nr:hypothetical protein SS50377_23873 [Spironucleus salmonicida]
MNIAKLQVTQPVQQYKEFKKSIPSLRLFHYKWRMYSKGIVKQDLSFSCQGEQVKFSERQNIITLVDSNID